MKERVGKIDGEMALTEGRKLKGSAERLDHVSTRRPLHCN
jgi:hypothetical protein